MEGDLSGGQSLAAADPIFYDVKFVDAQNGWIVGEFGKILRTRDGGETWKEQTKTLLEGTEFFDLLDLPTLFGLDAPNGEQCGRGRARGAHRAHARRRREVGVRQDRGRRGEAGRPAVRRGRVRGRRRLGVGAAGQVVQTEPGSDVWKRADIGQDVLTWLRAVSFSDPQYGWMVGGFGLIYHTEDGGKSWLPVAGLSPGAIA